MQGFSLALPKPRGEEGGGHPLPEEERGVHFRKRRGGGPLPKVEGGPPLLQVGIQN